GLLLAVTAGVLALTLVRLVAFAAGGFAAYLAIHSLGPPGWDEPLVCFLGGGLVGLFLFRLWIMVLTSFCGTLLMGYSGLCWLDGLGKVNAVALTTKREMLLNVACGALTVIGLVVQFLLERRRANNERLREQRTRILDEEELERLYRSRRRWGWGRRRPYRRAS
ncbi:MAG: hypothetical protein JO112_16575, partial [Planctomycetes bacterium]|nr:hypothetical protein [Planctomycetota bacterium]